MTRHRHTWSLEAACRGYEPVAEFADAFFEGKFEENLCASCPVMNECRDYAILHERFGYWGGQTPQARARARTQGFEELAFSALRDGWLEEHHLVSEESLETMRSFLGKVLHWEPLARAETLELVHVVSQVRPFVLEW